MSPRKGVVCALVCLAILASSTHAFTPTHEWQEVPKGESVPPGLHYRFDFEQDKVFAKLQADKAESDGSGAGADVIAHPAVVMKKSEEETQLETQMADRGLKRLAGEQAAQVRAASSALWSANDTRVAEALEELTEDADLVDVGMAIHQLNGTRALAALLQQKRLQGPALGLLGVMAQSAPQVQQAAVSAYALHRMVDIIGDAEAEEAVVAKALFALMAVCGSNERHTRTFVRAQGPLALRGCVQRHAASRRIQRKVWSFAAVAGNKVAEALRSRLPEAVRFAAEQQDMVLLEHLVDVGMQLEVPAQVWHAAVEHIEQLGSQASDFEQELLARMQKRDAKGTGEEKEETRE